MLAEISVIPIGQGVSLSGHVAKIAKIIHRSGLTYRMGPMGTVVEGTYDDISALIKKCHQSIMRDAERVIIHVVIDDRKDKKGPRIDEKVKSVGQKSGLSL
ncbi:MAG: MTH1187 family thiamine-binding protein [Candidatus Omnitrophota bacterium]